MMEVSQSALPADFKDIVQAKANGVIPTAAMVQEDVEDMDKLCFTDKDENVSIKEKTKSINKSPNGNVDFDIGSENLLNPSNVNGEIEEDSNVLETDDIDMLAEEFLNEIAEEDSKTDDGLLDNRVENECLTKLDEVVVQKETQPLKELENLDNEKSEENISKTKEADDKENAALEETDIMDEEFDDLVNVEDTIEPNLTSEDSLEKIPQSCAKVSTEENKTEEDDELLNFEKELEDVSKTDKDKECESIIGVACIEEEIEKCDSFTKEISKKPDSLDEADNQTATMDDETIHSTTNNQIDTENSESNKAITKESDENVEAENKISEQENETENDKQEKQADVEMIENEIEKSEVNQTHKDSLEDVTATEDDKYENDKEEDIEMAENQSEKAEVSQTHKDFLDGVAVEDNKNSTDKQEDVEMVENQIEKGEVNETQKDSLENVIAVEDDKNDNGKQEDVEMVESEIKKSEVNEADSLEDVIAIEDDKNENDKQEDVEKVEKQAEKSEVIETHKDTLEDVIATEDDKNERKGQPQVVEDKGMEEDTFMSELSAAIGDNDDNETSSLDKSKMLDGDIINLDSPISHDIEKDVEMESPAEESCTTSKNDEKPQNEEKENEKEITDGLNSDDDDIMLVESENEEKNEQSTDKLVSEEVDEKEKLEASTKTGNISRPATPDTEDDDVVLLDDKPEQEEEKESSSKPQENIQDACQEVDKKHPEEEKDDGNGSDDDVVCLIDDDKEELNNESVEKMITDKGKTSIDEKLDKEVANQKNEENINKDEQKEENELLEETKDSVTQEKKTNYESDDCIVLLDDDDDKEDEKSDIIKPKDDASNKIEEDNGGKDVEKPADEPDKKEIKGSDESGKEQKLDEDDDDDVVLLDDEKEEENIESLKNDKKEDDKIETAEEDANKEKISDEAPIEEEIFSINTSVTERQKLENRLKVDEDEDAVVLVSESSEKEETDKKECEAKIDGQSTEEKAKLDTDKASTETETNKIVTRSSSRKGSKETDSETEKNDVLVPDNSDNAQDKFPDKSADDELSNADGDNNLLQEVEPPQNSRSNEEDKQKFTEIESSEIDNSTEPPTKKIKVDSEENSQSSLITESKNQLKREASEEREKSLKRSLSPDSSSQEAKKIKTDGIEPKEEIGDTESKLELVKSEGNELLVPTPTPIKKVDLNLDFLKRFKKSISKMTKSDLEELVLQKIVEAVVHKSEFSEMRDLIEKQEKIIATHRTKIAEITKQFRDLEMVHNRVLKDLETKNQQFIMPVKITRAVGLQVLIPKRLEQQSGAKVSIDRPTGAAPPSTLQTLVNNTADVVKRKCAQKITPLRPDTQPSPANRATPNQNGVSSTSSATQMPATSSTPQNQTKLQQKIITRSAPTTPTTPQQNIMNVVNQQAQQTHYVVQQATLNQVSTPNQIQTVRKSTTAIRPAQPAVQRPPAAQTSPDRPRVPPMILKKTGANGRVLTVANPTTVAVAPQGPPQPSGSSATKSVIDLTDEDDSAAKASNTTLPALVAIPTATQPTRVTYVVNKPNSAPQRVTVTQNSTNMQRVPVKPGSQYVAIAPKPVQAVNAAPGPRLPTTTIVRRAHPAPLPKSPPALSNPGWKAPPPRPSIRINNIDSGIVISWTMDEMTDQHAEITSYQIYAYQETNAPPQVEAWRHVGDVKAMLLPMAVTLTQFQEGQRYFFAVRAVDMHSRCGPFSMPKTWT